jgi:hypothetical protein
MRVDPPADAAPTLQNDDAPSGFDQTTRGKESGCAGADDDDVLIHGPVLFGSRWS